MKVAIVTHAVRTNDGQGRVNYEIARAALAENISVTLIASNVAPELLSCSNVEWVLIRVGRWWPTNLLRQQIFALKSARWLRMHRKDYDVLHVNGFITWWPADVNTAHFVHNGWLRSGYFPFTVAGGIRSAYQLLYTRVNARLERWAYRRSRVVVAVSHKVAAELHAIALTPAQRVDVIHNGVDAHGFACARGDRARFGLPTDAFLLLFAGDLRTPRKNLDTVLAALKRLPDRVHLAVAGIVPGSPYPDEARALGIESRVHFLGLVKDMPVLMRSVDAFVFPSRYDPMGLVVLEAMAAGLPVVTARTVGGAEIMTPACGIVLDDPNDANALVAAIAWLAASADARGVMGAAAQELAAGYGWLRMAARYIALYRQLAGERGKSAGALVSIESKTLAVNVLASHEGIE
ncbi:MAG: hypothetical protein QOI13_3569 [Paraburkholderia sp.]|nr:hypothetical protein [Paraburkholderia sp.]